MSTRIEKIQWYKAALSAARAKSPEHEKHLQRKLALTDLFFLLVLILKRADANRDWIFDRCNEVQDNPNGHLDLWAREHYKSTIITFAKTIQDVLADPEMTVGLFSHTRPNAKAFLRQIKREFELNDNLKNIFSDVLWATPDKEAPKWSEDDGLVLKRKGNPKEATIEAWGLMEGMPTSKHFRLRVYDDIIDRKSVTNPDMIRRAIEAWELSLSLGQEGGQERYVGTRYHFSDPYREMMTRGAVKPRIYPCTQEGVWPGTPVLMSADELEKRRRAQGPYTFGAQMLQDPTADKLQGFKEEWLRFYERINDAEGMNTYIIGDPASEKKAESDYTAIVVIGLAPDENYYLLDAVRDRLNLRERADALFALHRRWRPRAVGWEKYGLQADIEYFRERMADINYRFEIQELGGHVAKHDRIRKLLPTFEAGRFWLPESLNKTDYEGRVIDIVQSFVQEEYKPFPVGLHEDMFDALARIVDEKLGAIWPKPREVEDRYAKPRRRPQRRYSHMAA